LTQTINGLRSAFTYLILFQSPNTESFMRLCLAGSHSMETWERTPKEEEAENHFFPMKF